MSSRPLAQKSCLTEKIGADEVIDYHTTNFAEVLADVDLVLIQWVVRFKNSFDVLNQTQVVLFQLWALKINNWQPKKYYC